MMLSFAEAKADLNEVARRIGFNCWTGTLSFKGVEQALQLKAGCSTKAKRYMRQKKSYDFSGPQCQMALHRYMQKAVFFDPNLLPSLLKPEHLWRYDGNSPHAKACSQLLWENQSRCRYSITIPLIGSNQLVYKLTFASALSPDELQQSVNENRKALWSAALAFANCSAQRNQLLNPVLEMGLISDKGHKVLSCITQGMSRDEISGHLHLTSRGVDYHVDKLKLFFNSNTLASLTASAAKFGL